MRLRFGAPARRARLQSKTRRAFPFRRSAQRMTVIATVAPTFRNLFRKRGVFAAMFLAPIFLACKEQSRPQRSAPVVAMVHVTRGPLPYVITASGQVEPNRTVAVQSLVSGMLTDVAITEGQEVRQGQVLFRIDPRPFSAELGRVRATLARDEAQLARARQDSARFAALARDGYVTQQQLEQAFGDVNALAATVDAGRASVESARLDLDNATVRAPISGRTGQLALRAGNLVRAQADPALVTINELSPVLVRFSVPENEFEELRRRAGLDRPLPVRITPGQAGDSLRGARGTLTFIDNTVDPSTGSVLLKARVDNNDRMLWPGQFVTVALELSVDTGAITVPTEAVVTTSTGTFVFVVDDSSNAHRTAVRVGRTIGPMVKIEEGLTGGEQVVVEGQSRLSDGGKVQQRETARAQSGNPAPDIRAASILADSAAVARRDGGRRQ